MTGTTQAGPLREAAMRAAMDVAGEPPRPKLRSLVCPFCGGVTPDAASCSVCSAPLDALSRQATQNQMGPWFVRDELGKGAFRPGCNYATIERMAKSGTIAATSVVRGPSTHQFWMLAKHTPGLAHMLGSCHNCGEPASADMFACRSCGEPFSVQRDRQHLGLGPTRPLPGSARVELLAMHARGADGAEDVLGPAVRVGEQGSPAAADDNTQPQSQRNELADAHELERSVKLLKTAWARERRRSMVSFVCATVICVLSLVVLWVS